MRRPITRPKVMMGGKDLWKNVILQLDIEVSTALNNIATREGQTVSGVIRRMLEKGVEMAAARAGASTIASTVRREARGVGTALENRLSKMLAKNMSASAANMFLSIQCIAAANKHDASKMYDLARSRGAEYLKQEGVMSE